MLGISVLIIFSVTVLFLCTVGNVVSEEGGLGFSGGGTWTEFEHGWPLVALNREVTNAKSNRLAIFEGNRNWNHLGVAIDGTIVACLFVAIVCVGYYVVRARRPLALSLRMLFAIFLILGIVAAHCKIRLARCAESQESAKWLEHHGFSVEYCYGGPVWLERLFGECVYQLAVFHSVKSAGIYNAEEKYGSEVASSLSRCDRIRELRLDSSHFSQRTIALILQATPLNKLEELSLSHTTACCDVSDSITRFTQLQRLYVNGTPIDDAFLDRIAALPLLEELDVSDTNVTLSKRGIVVRIPSLAVIVHDR
jgi:hypothetical protein